MEISGALVGFLTTAVSGVSVGLDGTAIGGNDQKKKMEMGKNTRLWFLLLLLHEYTSVIFHFYSFTITAEYAVSNQYFAYFAIVINLL